MAHKKKRTNLKRHHWTVRETKIYLSYLENHMELFADYHARKSSKVFLNIAKLLKTRKSHQVKSHHQKMMNKCGSIPNIIALLREIREVFDDSPSTQAEEDSNHPPIIQVPNDIWQIDPLDIEQSEENRDLDSEDKKWTESISKIGKNDEEEDIFEVLSFFGDERSQENEMDSLFI